MAQYEIYCSEEMVSKAAQLGSPLTGDKVPVSFLVYWLDDKFGESFSLVIGRNDQIPEFWDYYMEMDDACWEMFGLFKFKSRGEATLDALDHVLDYLISEKK